MTAKARGGVAKVLACLALLFLYAQYDTAQTNPPPPPKKVVVPPPKQPPKKQKDAAQQPPPKQILPKGGPVNPPPPKGGGAGPSGGGGATPALTPGKVKRPDGGSTVTDNRGNRRQFDQTGRLQQLTTKRGTEGHFGQGGKVTSVRTPDGTTVLGTPGGPRTVISDRVSLSGMHYRVVNGGPRNVYVERPFRFGGRDYIRRTNVYGTRTSVTVYRGSTYRGVTYYRYVPARYYGPAYYRWAYTPWPTSVPYAWGWAGNPWYGYYGNYWAPYPVYQSPAFWLTDYVIAANLQAAYDAQAQAAAANRGAPPAQTAPPAPNQNSEVTMTPEVKQMVEQTVDQRLAELQKESEQPEDSGGLGNAGEGPAQTDDGVPEALDPDLKVFIVGTALELNNDGQSSCLLNPGDVLVRTDTDPDANHAVGVNVVSSQKSSCPVGATSRVQVADLQEMYNHLGEQLDGGMSTLSTSQWKTGAPAPAPQAKDNMDFKKLPTAPDTATLAVDLRQQQVDADQAQKEVQQEAGSIGNAAAIR